MTEHVATFSNVKVGTETAAGSAYVKKVTHPPTTIPLEFAGVPDASAPNMVPLEVKSEINVPTSYNVATTLTNVTTVSATRMMFLTPSGNYVGSYVFYFDGVNWTQQPNQAAIATVQPAVTGNVPATTMSGYNFGNYAADVAQARTTYKSTTFYLNATEFNNQGTVTTAKFKPSILTTSFAQLRKEHPKSDMRGLLKDIRKKIHMSNSKSTKQDVYDYVSEDDLDANEYDYTVQIYDVATNAAYPPSVNYTNAFSIGNTYVNVFPVTPSDLMVVSPKANTRPAKDGAFVVQQPVQSTQDWAQVVDPFNASVGSPPSP